MTLLGRLGQDPESRETKDGRKVVTFSVATDVRWHDRSSGDLRERTEWHRIVIFNERLADVAAAYLRKGNQVYLEGQLQTRHWNDADEQPRITTEIVLSGYQARIELLEGCSAAQDEEVA
ncbi:MAG: single-stranded DNA-binding protein [Geminicoccaceae bacterium]